MKDSDKLQVDTCDVTVADADGNQDGLAAPDAGDSVKGQRGGTAGMNQMRVTRSDYKNCAVFTKKSSVDYVHGEKMFSEMTVHPNEESEDELASSARSMDGIVEKRQLVPEKKRSRSVEEVSGLESPLLRPKVDFTLVGNG